MKFSRRDILAGVAGCAALATHSYAQNLFGRSVKVVVPFTAGGTADVMARLWAEKISERVGSSFYVENMGGAGSNLGIGYASRQSPDGSTILAAPSAFAINPSIYGKIPYDPIKSFDPITMLAITPTVLIAHPEFPARTFDDFVKLVRERPATYSAGHSGNGTPPHLQGELLKLKLGLDMTPVPFTGGPQPIQMVISGHLPVAFVGLPSVPGLVEAGKLRALAVSGSARSHLLPNVPTFAELGITELESGTWVGIFVPRGAPQPVIDRLTQESGEIVKSKDVIDRMRQIGAEPVSMTAGQFAQRLQKEIDDWARIVQLAKLEKQ